MSATGHDPRCWLEHPSCALHAARAIPRLPLHLRVALLEAALRHQADGGCREAGALDDCAQVVQARRLLTDTTEIGARQ